MIAIVLTIEVAGRTEAAGSKEDTVLIDFIGCATDSSTVATSVGGSKCGGAVPTYDWEQAMSVTRFCDQPFSSANDCDDCCVSFESY